MAKTVEFFLVFDDQSKYSNNRPDQLVSVGGCQVTTVQVVLQVSYFSRTPATAEAEAAEDSVH